MLNARHVDQGFESRPVVIRALSSLTQEHARQIAEAVQGVDPDWELDLLDDYDGYLSVLVSRQDEAEGQPCYLISGSIQQIQLSEIESDAMRQLGVFDTIDQAIALLTARLSKNPASPLKS